jgi:large subunit ribosomal protein L23
MQHAIHILKHLRLTEKSNKLSSELGQYTFVVDIGANKHQIAQAVEDTFKVTVRRVNTMTLRGKNKKSRQGRPSIGSDYKKAIVTLKQGDKIELV